MFKTAEDCMFQIGDRLDSIYSNNKQIGVPMGFADIDEIVGGLQPSRLITIAGRPSMGKSIFAMNIAQHVAINSNLPVLIFSMETTASDLMMRMTATLARIDLFKIQRGLLVDEDWPRFSAVFELLSNAKIFIDDSPCRTPQEITERANKLSLEYGQLGLIVVDYIQLMNVEAAHQHSRSVQISEITRSLKALANELNVSVLALSQLNRDCDNRIDKRPLLNDLLDSSAIENDSDIIIFIYRDEVYYDNSFTKDTAEIIIAKNRHGPIAKVRLSFKPYYQVFE